VLLAIAKLLLFARSAFALPVIPNLECGVYLAHGHLRRGAHGEFKLILQERSSSPFELILLGGGSREKLTRVDSVVKVAFYVPAPIHDNQLPNVFLQGFLRAEPGERDVVVKKAPAACGDMKRYRE
jgi:hypothetical protein